MKIPKEYKGEFKAQLIESVSETGKTVYYVEAKLGEELFGAYPHEPDICLKNNPTVFFDVNAAFISKLETASLQLGKGKIRFDQLEKYLFG